MTWETAVKPRRGRINAHGSKVVGAQKRKPVDEIGFRADWASGKCALQWYVY